MRERLLEPSLRQPVRFAENASRKKLRAKVLELASSMNASPEMSEIKERNRKRLTSLIEDIHQGSLIVDDIQDGSRTRRNKPALHEVFGVPIALNAGNFLYFRALELSLEMELPPERILLLHKILVCAMREAHEGQAIDLGTNVEELEQMSVREVSIETARSKTGALLRASFGSGYLLNDSFSQCEFDALLRFGEEWGIALQQLDDIGHYLSSLEGKLPEGKAFEDFTLGRPTWVWAIAAQELEREEYEIYRALARRDPGGKIVRSLLLDSGLLHQAASTVLDQLNSATEELQKTFNGEAAKLVFERMNMMNEVLMKSFILPRSFSPPSQLNEARA